MVEVNCSYCGKLVNRRPNVIKRMNNLFCSRNCYYKFRKEHNVCKHLQKSKALQKILHLAKLKEERNNDSSN